jgi:hypothetical protein
MLRMLLGVTALSVSAAAQAPLRPAEPRELIAVVLDAFDSTPVVAALDAHRHDELHRINLARPHAEEFFRTGTRDQPRSATGTSATCPVGGPADRLDDHRALAVWPSWDGRSRSRSTAVM